MSFQVTDDLYFAISQAANYAGVSMSEFIRNSTDKAAMQRIAKGPAKRLAKKGGK